MSPRPRRRSIDSSDSDSSCNKHKLDKEHNHHETRDYGYNDMPSTFTKSATEYNQHTLLGGAHSTPPPYSAAPALPAPPSSGFRIPLSTTGVFPDPQTLGPPPCYDADGSPIYIGSALLGNSVHPCKIGKHLQTHVAVPYGGAEYYHKGRYDLLPYRPDQMEFVPTSYGRIPPGRRLVEGGYEDHGAKLYHAVALINGIRVPGKAAEHLGGCNVAFGGAEHIIQGNYEILCWR
ncbi:hypothetical protein BYT27DRAFT_7222843 [Phlegmacium glaucopus]|nr:hypothetical protein BYT27DRAFT_7222843 [Phlegmacium glaucopus]